ncbi:hypothetical protein HanXRQr2_Chr16g0765531 [Helianthus annuus]|uniref:Uncharacterized protein n=1 Tax=Helianthus annuus TaxID=4232 RepID=A0A9K3DVW3_HELAN|nr:hypothetical protein HanXRQr2_Chr16g0765531 [Helianthus annuus]KAJ0822580.1 hypothetical protein HanPSC8_Chr16g0733721 [Helianthus annuus]
MLLKYCRKLLVVKFRSSSWVMVMSSHVDPRAEAQENNRLNLVHQKFP